MYQVFETAKALTFAAFVASVGLAVLFIAAELIGWVQS